MELKYIKITVVVIATVVLFCTCAQSYPGLEYTGKDDWGGNSEGTLEVPIMLFSKETGFFSMIATRGTGAFDSDNDAKLANSRFYVYAFRAENTDFTKTKNKDVQQVYDSDGDVCLVDNEHNYLLGKEVRICKSSTYPDYTGEMEFVDEQGTPEILYYSTKHQETGYNFFGYYIDDFQPTEKNATREKDRIYYDIDIDGCQDIICGYAPKLTPNYVASILRKSGNYNETDRNNIVNFGYSTYAAHRNVNPIIKMNHLLTRLKFQIYPGDETARNITITGIKVTTRYKGRLTVAAKDTSEIGLQFYDDEKAIYLREMSEDGLNTEELKQDFYQISLEEGEENVPLYERHYRNVGESMMIPSTESVKVTIEYDEETNGKKTHTEAEYEVYAPKNELYRNPKTGKYMFKEGYCYTMKIVVYGLQPIQIMANIEGWQDADDPIYVDPDDNFVDDL